MSALSARPLDASRIDPEAWVRLSDAARLLDENEGALRRRCSAELEAQGLAVKIKPRKGNAHWVVNRDLDPALALDLPAGSSLDEDGVPATHTALDALEAAPKAKRDAAFAKARAVCLFREWRERGGNVRYRFKDEFLPQCEDACGLTPSWRTLYRWDKAAENAESFDDVAVALLDGRSSGSRNSSVDPKCWALFESLYLTFAKLTAQHCHRRVAAYAEQEGMIWCSLSRLYELIDERIPPERRCMLREGHEAWQAKYQRPLEQGDSRFEVGECWESDHSTMDCYVRVPTADGWTYARPYVAVWYDWRSGLICGWHASLSADADSVRKAMLNALRRDRISAPKKVWLDNGKAFTAGPVSGGRRALNARKRGEGDEITPSLMSLLGIDVHFAQVRNHNGKARTESWFGLMHEEVCKIGGSYKGNKPGSVDEVYERKLRKNPETLPTLDQIKILLEHFTRAYNARTDHNIERLTDHATGEQMSPFYAYHTHLPSIRRIPADKIRLLEHEWYGPYKVSKRGVSVKIVGVGTQRYYTDATRALVGTEHRVFATIDPADISTARIYNAQCQFIGIARSELHDGTDKQALKEALARRRAEKRRASAKPDIDAVVLSAADLAYRQKQERDIIEATAKVRENVPDMGPNLRYVPCPLDGQGDAVEAAERKLAAGGEHDPAPPVDLADLFADECDESDADDGLGLTLDDLDGDDGDGWDDDIDILGALGDE